VSLKAQEAEEKIKTNGLHESKKLFHSEGNNQ
jgi:hypothetical protein